LWRVKMENGLVMRGEHGIGYEEVDLKGVVMAGNEIEERRNAVEAAHELGSLGEDCENGDGESGHGMLMEKRQGLVVHSGGESREEGEEEEGPTTPTGPAGSGVDRKDRMYKKGPWSVPEMVVLQSAKREDVVRAGKGVPGVKHRTAQEKWQSIEDYCWLHFVQRSAQQCQDKWESLSAEFKKVKDFECAGQKPYWLITIDERKSVRVPPNFQREVYTALCEWYDKNRIIEPGMHNLHHPSVSLKLCR
jgi:hypothetical protein